MRTDQEIVDQTNQLARILYKIRGYEVDENHKFYENRRNFHPHELDAWRGACEAQLLLTNTDPNEALDNLDYDDHWDEYQSEHDFNASLSHEEGRKDQL
jgi:hypothetical protein